MRLDIVLNANSESTSASSAHLLVLKIEYEYPPLYIENGCNLVVPWSKNGHGSIGGVWLM
jgi:hypothetical protein